MKGIKTPTRRCRRTGVRGLSDSPAMKGIKTFARGPKRLGL